MAITSLQFTRSYQDVMRCFVCTVHERENQLTKLLFLDDDIQTGGNLVNLREHKDAIRSTMCPGSPIENKKKCILMSILNVTLEQIREGKNCMIKAVTAGG